MAITTNLYYHCWFARVGISRDSPLLVGPHVALPFYHSPPFFVAPIFLFHNSTHTQLKTHKQRQKKERKTKTKRRIKKPQKPQIKTQDKKNKKIMKTLNKTTQKRK
jgi:hypothetical protein